MNVPLAVPVHEAGKMLSLTPKVIRRLIKDQRLAARKVGKKWFVPTAELQRFVEERENA